MHANRSSIAAGHGRDGWNPYLAGALVGLLAILSVLFSTLLLGKAQYLGASTTFVRAAGLIENLALPEHVAANAYFIKEKIKVDWQMMFVVGIFIGAWFASILDNSFMVEKVPPIWRERFGDGVGRRALGAVLGGIVAMFGARMAGGCPSGHGLSGLMQMAVSGYLALFGFFGAGILVAHLLYRKGGRP